MYKVSLRGSTSYIGKIYHTLPEARKVKEEAGLEYHIYKVVYDISKFGKVMRSWEKVE